MNTPHKPTPIEKVMYQIIVSYIHINWSEKAEQLLAYFSKMEDSMQHITLQSWKRIAAENFGIVDEDDFHYFIQYIHSRQMDDDEAPPITKAEKQAARDKRDAEEVARLQRMMKPIMDDMRGIIVMNSATQIYANNYEKMSIDTAIAEAEKIADMFFIKKP